MTDLQAVSIYHKGTGLFVATYMAPQNHTDEQITEYVANELDYAPYDLMVKHDE